MLFPRGALSSALAILSPRAATDSTNATGLPTNSTPFAEPYVVPPSQVWDGNDGVWASFPMTVGRQPQQLRGFPSTVASANWVSWGGGACTSGIPLPPGTGDCAKSRGGLFNENASATYVPGSDFFLGVTAELGIDAVDKLGYDTLQLSYNTGPSLDHQVIALNAWPYYWLGTIGLSSRPVNLTNLFNPQNSTLFSMKQGNHTPSLSYGYTAGAYYRYSRRVYGSLIMGGYDESLYTPSNFDIRTAADAQRDLVVAVRGVSSNATSANLLPSGTIFAQIDSTFPFIWLPIDACRAFETAFNLTWNSQAELYILNASTHNALLQSNPSVTLQIGANDLPNGPNVNITFPYAAFDHNVSFPWVGQSNGTQFYFPLKQAQNQTQYTLGRAFLQEAYLTVDYERGNFSVHARKWADPSNAPPSNIKSIYPSGVNVTFPVSNEQTSGSDSSSGGLAAGTIAGIVVGVVAAVCIVSGLVIWYLFRQRRYRRERAAALAADEAAKDAEGEGSEGSGQRLSGAMIDGQLHGDPKIGLATGPAQELGTPNMAHEAPTAADGEGGKSPHGELPGSGAGAWEADSSMRYELVGSEVPLGMSEKMGGAKLVNWDGNVATEGDGSLERIQPARDPLSSASRSRSRGSPTSPR